MLGMTNLVTFFMMCISFCINGLASDTWANLAKLNSEFSTAKKPLSQDEFSRYLENGDKILLSSNFDSAYQKMRTIFLGDQPAQAEKIPENLKPLFNIQFAGDYDVYDLNFGTLLNAVKQDSPEALLMHL